MEATLTKPQVKQATAQEGAHSVAEAVKRVADAAVAEIAKVVPQDNDLDFSFSGKRGGLFVAEGPIGTFGTSGTIKLAGMQLHTTSWSTQRIEGRLPSEAVSGEVLVYVDEKTIRKSRFQG